MAINGETVLAVIPARGASKRAPGKNLRLFRGKPLIQWTVEAAAGSKYIDDLILSSEDDRVLAHGRILGITVLKRPDWLATDRAMNEGVLAHVLYTYKMADWVVLLQPTSPLRITEDIDICIERAAQDKGCMTFSEYGNRNGAVYVVHSKAFLSGIEFPKEMFKNFYIMPNERSFVVPNLYKDEDSR